MQFDLICIGDTTLDTFLELEDASVLCDIDKTNCKLCFDYAEKIPVKSVNQAIGGNAANVAVGTSRLGLKTSLVTILGDDSTGREAKSILKSEKIDLSLVTIDKGKRTNYSTILNLQGERTILIFHEKRNYCPVNSLPKSSFAYITSMKDGWECMLERESLLSWISNNSIKVAYNPGTYQIRAGIDNSKPLLEKTEILFLNKKEAQIWIKSKNEDVEFLAREYIKMGVKIVVITDGENGSYALINNKFYTQEVIKAKRIEATGAGDSYASGFLSAIFYGKSVREAMIWGSINSASVIEKIGSQKGLLNRDKIEKIVSNII